MTREIGIPLTVLLALAIPASAPAAIPADEPGTLLREHPLRTLDGDPVRLDRYTGQVLVVNFWASWCVPCREELSLLDRWDAAWRERGARVVAVSIDREQRNARRLAEELALELLALHDGPEGLAARLDLAAVPSTYLLDRQGRVVMVVAGSDREDLERLRREVEALLNGERSRS